ncbi:hypothetical protein PRZ48_004793 [Zasmidium cellare]|uniref:Uncharacterized protein n=1 Tax=Zasmidium cellare TaxID=395010 RepID=A0ABR0ERZ0_ZASCE|nr:hypothetical protein PRZ48_004793 [Zasmidium cellare]
MDIEFLEDIDVSDGPNLELVSCRPLPCQPGDDSTIDSAASGRWFGEEDLGQATFASVISLGFTLGDLDFMTDHEILASLDAADEADAEDDNASTRGTSPSIPDSDLMSEISDILREAKRGYKLYSSSIPEDDDDDDNERVPETEEEDQDESNERNPGSTTSPDEDDSGCDCGDAECRVCCELPIHHDDGQLESKSSNSKNVFTSYEHGEGEDVEHADPHERIGMVYEEFEPSILLACKEIREECLAIYYSRNSFSWRFSWTDYLRSCLRFKYWAKAVSTHHISLITRITFQGRHVVEEGVEFSIDIDLFDEYPFFETRSYAEEDADIASAIHREMASYLWLMVQTTRRRPTLSVGHVLELASIFVQGMHRQVAQTSLAKNMTNGSAETLEDAS